MPARCALGLWAEGPVSGISCRVPRPGAAPVKLLDVKALLMYSLAMLRRPCNKAAMLGLYQAHAGRAGRPRRAAEFLRSISRAGTTSANAKAGFINPRAALEKMVTELLAPG